MRTRSQAKKQKLEKRKIPQLNEDVLGIILKHVVKKQQKYVSDTIAIIGDHLYPDRYMLKKYDHRSSEIKWPDHLDSNSRRLIHHTNVKLFPNYKLVFPTSIEHLIKSKRDSDLLWKTVKYFDFVTVRQSFDYNTQSTSFFVRSLYEKSQASSSLMKKLEERLT